MDLDELQAEISLLLSQMEAQPEDCRELYIRLQEKLGELKAMGLPIPEDLKRLERQLEAEFLAASQGR